jgi:hypothetical protein
MESCSVVRSALDVFSLPFLLHLLLLPKAIGLHVLRVGIHTM